MRGVLRELGWTGAVKSPTYTLVEYYPISSLYLYHFDFYRLRHPDEWVDAGFRDYFNTAAVCLIEWPEKAGPVLPPPDIKVFLAVSGLGRDVECQALSDQGSQCLDRLHFAPNL